MAIKILFFTDLHCRAMRPVSRLDEDFFATQLAKLAFVARLSRDCDLTILGGDITDRPDASPSVVIQLLRAFCKFKSPPYTVIGNHDCLGYHKNSVDSSVIGIMLEHGAIRKLDYYDLPGIQIYGIHAYDECQWTIPESDALKILVVHKMITDKAIPNVNCLMTKDIATATNADIVLSGDIHTPHNVTHGGKVFLNPGSLSRMSIADKDRQPQVLILTIDDDRNVRYDYVSVPSESATEAFDTTGYATRLEADQHTKDFVKDYASVVMSVKTESHKIGDIINKFMADNAIPEKMKALLIHYFEEAEEQALNNSKEN